jgi:hypothetical protein
MLPPPPRVWRQITAPPEPSPTRHAGPRRPLRTRLARLLARPLPAALTRRPGSATVRSAPSADR